MTLHGSGQQQNDLLKREGKIMKAVVCTKYGPPEGLQLREVEKPLPKDDEILVKIHATTVTSGDVILRTLKFPLRLVFRFFFGLGKNKILGHELAGEIESTGKNVTRFKPGDQVFASAGSKGGAYAEFISLPENGMVATKPENISFEEAAAVPVGGNTALYILRDGDIQEGHSVLIYGASGSVGTYAVQLASNFGGQVTGVCSTSNIEMVKSLGAKKVIDYTREDVFQTGETYDVIFDAVRKTSPSSWKSSLSKDGTFLSVSAPTKERTENLNYLKELIEAGEIKVVIDRSYSLNQIPDAHRYVEKGHKKGNVVIQVVTDDKI